MASRALTITLPRTASVERVVVKEVEVVSVPSSEIKDTQGNTVPVWKPHAFSYDGSGNLATDTVSDGVSTWVRTYGWANGAQTTDSGWVKQNG